MGGFELKMPSYSPLITFPLKKKESKNPFFLVITVIIFIIVITVLFFSFFQTKTGALIQDGSLHFSFTAPKGFKRLTAQQIATYNPSFVYVFTAPDNNSATCFVSQTPHFKKGLVRGEELLTGLIRYLEEQHEKYSVLSKEKHTAGIQNAVQVAATYQENRRAVKQTILATADKEKTTFVSCTAPLSEYNLYKSQFDTMVSSFKITN